MEANDPTHALFSAEGSLVGIVFPDHYPETADLRPLPEDYWTRGFYRWDGEAFVDDLEAAQTVKWDEVKAHREALETGIAPLAAPLGPVQIDEKSKMKITALHTLAIAAAAMEEALGPNSEPIFLEEFTLADNRVVTLTSSLALVLGMSVAGYVSRVFAAGRALRDQIYAEDATVASVLAIDVEAAFAAALASGEG